MLITLIANAFFTRVPAQPALPYALRTRRSVWMVTWGLIWIALLCFTAPVVHAHEGHDHEDTPPVISGDGPKRQADGSVLLPESVQRLWNVRTLRVAPGQHPQTYELDATVVMDPNAGGKVQAAQSGRLEAGPKGLPVLGQTVRKGEILAYVQPTVAAIERSNHVAQHAELRAAHALAVKHLHRLQELADTVARKDIETAQSQERSLAQRLAAVGAGLSGREALVAPVSGVIASSHAVVGQILDARELVFEVVNPRRLRIEALAYDIAQGHDIQAATLALGRDSIALRFVGAARSLRAQALPLVFVGEGAQLSALALGQSVRVFAQSSSRITGMQVPQSALQRNRANQHVVWIAQDTEHFVPRAITYAPLDGASVAVTSGLQPGERVVTHGAALLNQVR